MRTAPPPLVGIGAILVVGLVLPLTGSVVLSGMGRSGYWEHPPFHSVVEALGGFIALLLAGLLAQRAHIRQAVGEEVWIAAALTAMGVLDIAHAAGPVGGPFVWYHSVATLLGGLLFSCVWLPVEPRARWLPIAVATASVALVAGPLLFDTGLPVMLREGRFTPTARALNTVGGIGFYAASLYFCRSYWTTRTWDSLLFAAHCMLFGSAGILFEGSELWDGPWWWWHGARLAAYFVALGYIAYDGLRRERLLVRLNTELDTANQTLESSVEVRTAELGHAHTRLLDEMASRQRLEEERWTARLRQTQKLESLGLLAGGIAHDFNNLLAGMVGNADLVLQRSTDDGVKRAAERILRAGTRASNLTRELLAYSGRGSFAIETLDLNAEIRDMAELLSASLSKRASLAWALSSGPLQVEADRAQLQQVVMNLLTNAADAIGEGDGTITLTSGVVDADGAYLAGSSVGSGLEPGRYAFLEVSDTGCGMDLATQDRMFDPFFTTKEVGRGLGLSAILGIVRGHHGALRVDSAPGQGTRIRLLLPPAAAPSETDEEGTPDERRGAGLILVIDDEEEIRELLGSALPTLGFRALLAEDGATGVRLFAEHVDAIRGVVLDLTMPGMSGEDVFEALCRIQPQVRVLVSSGYSEQTFADRFGGLRQVAFLPKPYRLSTLQEQLRSLLG